VPTETKNEFGEGVVLRGVAHCRAKAKKMTVNWRIAPNHPPATVVVTNSGLREFHPTHHSTPEQTFVDMTEAFAWLSKSVYAAEAKPLEELAKKKSRGARSIGDLLLPLFNSSRSGRSIWSRIRLVRIS